MVEIFNYIEAIFWISIGITYLYFANTKTSKLYFFFVALTFITFGISDIVEANTGAWWKPLWLFFWKAICLISFIILIIVYYTSILKTKYKK
jgi:hypothetical protein